MGMSLEKNSRLKDEMEHWVQIKVIMDFLVLFQIGILRQEEEMMEQILEEKL